MLAPAEHVNWEAVGVRAEARRRLEMAKGRGNQGKVTVYEGFGSFHSENVEDLMALDDSQYTPPANLPAFAQRILNKRELTRVNMMTMALPTYAPTTELWKAGPSKRPREESECVATSAEYASALCSSESVDGAAPCEHDDKQSGESAEYPSSCHRQNSVIDVPLLAELCSVAAPPCPMGIPFMELHFNITPEMTFINHGAFGSTLAGAMAVKHMYELTMEREVVSFVDRQLLPLIVYSIRSLGSFLRADPRQLVLVQNATFGLNCAMRLIASGEVVAFLDTEYLSVYKMMWSRCKEVGAEYHELPVAHLLHDEELMGDDAKFTEEVCRQLPEGCTTFIVDFVTSTSALQLPVFTHLIPALRRRGVRKIIVDGAHAPLQIDLDFKALPSECQPSVFVGNLHKWFSAPKSVGFVWVRAQELESIHSVVLSHGAGDGLLSEFIWDGTRDYGAYLSIPAIVNFWKTQDCGRVRRHCSALLQSATAMLTEAFVSRKVARHAPFMSLVELPEQLQDQFVTSKYIQDVLHSVYSIEIPVKRVNNRHYLRVSAFVYNTPEDYSYLREAVLAVAEAWASSEERRKLVSEYDAAVNAGESRAADGTVVPCDERIRRQGGCGVSGLDPSLKRKKTSKFS